MSTPVSPVTTYISNQDVLTRFDARSIGDRLRDDGTRAPVASILQGPVPGPASADYNTLQTLIFEAGGLVETALLRSKRYLVTDLQTVLSPNYLMPGQTTSATEYLKGLVAGVTIWLIFERRPMPGVPVPARAQMAMAQLKDIQDGKSILALDEVASAGVRVPMVAPDEDNPVAAFLPEPLTTRTSDYFGDRFAG